VALSVASAVAAPFRPGPAMSVGVLSVEFMDRTVYVLHFDQPVIGNAQHYTGITRDLRRRLISHAFGDGAGFTRAAQAKGIPFTLAYTIVPARGLDELAVKHVAAWRHCPLCGGNPERAVGNKVSGQVILTPEEWEVAEMEASFGGDLRRIRSTELTDDPVHAAARRMAALKAAARAESCLRPTPAASPRRCQIVGRSGAGPG
jgi:predicted GIY-YIG superfamily endonuclease